MAKTFIFIGVLLIGLGIFLSVVEKLSGWGGLGRLPGDIYIKKENFSFYFPVTTSLLLSLLVTLILRFFQHFQK